MIASNILQRLAQRGQARQGPVHGTDSQEESAAVTVEWRGRDEKPCQWPKGSWKGLHAAPRQAS